MKTGLFHYPITHNCSNVLSLFISSDQSNHHDPSAIQERPHIQTIEKLFVSPSRISEPSELNGLNKRALDFHIRLAFGFSVPKKQPYPVNYYSSWPICFKFFSLAEAVNAQWAKSIYLLTIFNWMFRWLYRIS